jgi:hypothetical protein
VTLVTPKVSGAKLQTRILSALVLGGFGGFVTLSGGLVWALWMSLASYLVRGGVGRRQPFLDETRRHFVNAFPTKAFDDVYAGYPFCFIHHSHALASSITSTCCVPVYITSTRCVPVDIALRRYPASAKEYFTMTATMTSELPHPPPKWAGDLSIFLCSIFSLVVFLCGGKLTYVVMATLGRASFDPELDPPLERRSRGIRV